MYKKRILALSIAALLVTSSSCGSSTASTASAETMTSSASSGAVSTVSSVKTPTDTEVASVSDPSSTSSSGTAKESTSASTKALVPDMALDAILDKVTNYEEGTAGSSLKQAKIAGELLDWVEDSLLKQKDIEEQISYYLQSAGTSAQEDQFALHFSDMSKTVLLIIGKDSYTLSSLTDAGYTPAHSEYTQSKWDTFATAVQLEINAY